MRNVVFGLTALVALACTSCGQTTPIYAVAGKVTYLGAPAKGATVFFYRQGADPMNEHTIMAIVQKDGSFEVVCGSLGKGAPAGAYDVLIEWKPVTGQTRGQPERAADKLQGRYADRQHPRFQVAIKPEPNRLAPFEVTD